MVVFWLRAEFAPDCCCGVDVAAGLFVLRALLSLGGMCLFADFVWLVSESEWSVLTSMYGGAYG